MAEEAQGGESSGGEEGGEGVLTMMDVLQEGRDLEENANAVLGGASESECSYSSGYMARQPLYACTTCSDPAAQNFRPAGVCLACSYHCHEGHTLVELYTKRAFRCDCGTRGLAACRLLPGREESGGNKYNQNFSGLYCECSRPYPDPENPDDTDCMVQCLVCEDWYHGRHLGVDKLPEETSYAELVCRGCVGRLPFLQHYSGLAITALGKEGDAGTVVDTEGDTSTVVDTEGPAAGDTEEPKGSKEKSTETKDPKEPPGCALTVRPAAPPRSLFLPGGWRRHLCACAACVQVYADTGTAFLPLDTDTVHHYEAQAKEAKETSVEEKGMEALGQMDRVKQVEAIHSYNNMKENLMEYLAKFANSKKVVREEDIKEFFDEMKSNKKKKLDGGGGPPPSCK